MFLYLENDHGRIEAVNTDHVIRVQQALVPITPKGEDFEEDPNHILVYLMPDGKYRRYQGTVRDFVITVENLSKSPAQTWADEGEAALAQQAQSDDSPA